MATLHRTRLVAIGCEEDMQRLCRVMLENVDRYEEPEDRRPYTLEELYDQVRKCAAWEESDSCSFLYNMVTPGAYGSSEAGTGRFELCMFEPDLWAAAFTYDSTSLFQAEDWVALHKRCNRMPLFCIHADENFALAKGYLTISNGMVNETWALMAESWLWLLDQYETGYPPEEILPRLEHLQSVMEQEDWDQTVEELLASCEENLMMIREYPPVTAEAMQQQRESRDFAGLFEMQAQLADTLLWDSARSTKYLACLEAAAEAWAAQK